MRWLPPFAGLLFLFATLFLGVRACAAGAPARVALARPHSTDSLITETAARIRGELVASGFEVVEIDIDPDRAVRAQVESADLTPKPIAILAILPLPNRPAVDLWVSDRLTEKTVVRRLEMGKGPEAQVTAALAIHAVELLRASLLEIENPGAASEAPQAPPSYSDDVLAWVKRSGKTPPVRAILEGPAISVGAGVIHTFGDVGTALTPVARISMGWSSGLAARLGFLGPAFGGDVRSAAGSASVRQEMGMADLAYAPLRGRLSPLVSLGAGAYHLHVRGTAAASFTARSDDVWSFLADVGVGGCLRLGSSAAIWLDLHTFILQPGARIAVGDASIGPIGRPSFSASAGLAAAL